MISGTFLRVLTTSGTATGTVGKKIISQNFAVIRNACKEESYPLQTASYHKTAIRGEDVPEGKEMDTNIVTKTKIAEILAHDFDISKSKAERIIDKIFNEISQNLVDGNRVSISGFGAFTKIEVKERNGRNPRTGEPIVIPSGLRAKFTSFHALKEKINS